jgi:thioester reductase-like protein
VGDILEIAARREAEHPTAPLYSFLDVAGEEVEALTREGFMARVRLIASHLSAMRGVVGGDRILLAYPPGLEMICAFFACAHVGLIPAPAAAPTPATLETALHRLEHMARDCAPVAVLTTSEVTDLVLGQWTSLREEAVSQPRLATLPWIPTERWTEPRGAPWAPRHSSIFFLQYTSGSTSEPKGVIVTHDNVLANARLTVDHDNAVGVCWLPQHHDMGLIGYYLNAAIAGVRLYGFAPASFMRRPAMWLQILSARCATATSAPNFALELCLRRSPALSGAAERLDLSSLKFLMVAAEPVRPDTYRRFLQTYAPFGLNPDALVVAYGLAENTLAVSSYGRRTLSLSRRALASGRAEVTTRVAEIGEARHLMSCGRILDGNQVLIVDPEHRRAQPDRRVGEIWVAGESRCLGYWNNPSATAETFEARLTTADREGAAPYLRTGDMGFVHQGELYVCGRRKDMIVVRGQNHYPQDIEAVVAKSSSAVRLGGIAVFQEDDDAAKIVILAELANSRVQPDAAAIAAMVRRELGISPDDVLFIPARSLPKTGSGKIRRFLAKQMVADGRIPVISRFSADRESGAGETIRHISGPFAEIRRRYRLTGEEPATLADAGVDSLDLVLVLHELSELATAAGAGDLTARLHAGVVQHASIAQLFAVARGLEAGGVDAMAQLRRLVSRDIKAGAGHNRMRADLRTALPRNPLNVRCFDPEPRRILLTGGTGFLGPFLLTSLLQQTAAEIHVLVRATDASDAAARLRANLEAVAPRPEAFWAAFERRVVPVVGDLAKPRLGLDASAWSRLAEGIDAIYHNGALVNYLLTYERMRAANVAGTGEILRMASELRPKVVNYVSTTFIFGWATKDVLSESDDNSAMEALDFGYSQSKWVAEQLVLRAARSGVPTRIFRPALITPSITGGGSNCDITLRLLAFMIKHGIGVEAANQVSFLPADVTADNIVAIAGRPDTLNQTFHMTRDHYAGMADVLEIITRLTGRRFERFDLKSFVPEVIRRCTREDPVFPLLDFLVGSVDSIGAMEFKRYENQNYQRAREACAACRPEPTLDDTVHGILRYLDATGMIDVSLAPTSQ